MPNHQDPTVDGRRGHRRWRRWLVVPLLVIALLLLGWAHHHFLTSGERYADSDFMAQWAGGRALWESLDPYDHETWIALRSRYGSTWMPDARAPLPLWTLMLVSPFSALPLGWSAAAWQVFLELTLAASVLLLLTVARRQRPTLTEALLLLFGAFTMRGTLISLINGQITLLLLLVLTGFLVLFWRGRPFLAGAVLSLVALKPNAFLLFVPLLGLWLLLQKRWRVIAGSVTGGALLFGVSFLVRPGWLTAWLTVRGKTEATHRTPTVWGTAYLLAPDTWPALGLLLAVGVSAAAGWLLLRREQREPAYVVGLALCASLIVTPYAWAYEHALIVLPLALLFAASRKPWQAWTTWWTLVSALPWLLYWIAIQLDSDALSVLVPVVTGIAFMALMPRDAPLPPPAPAAESATDS